MLAFCWLSSAPSFVTLHAQTVKSAQSVVEKFSTTVRVSSEAGTIKGNLLHQIAAKNILFEWENGEMSHLQKLERKEDMLSLALKYNLVTSLTSLVAIEHRENNLLESELTPTPFIYELLESENDSMNYDQLPDLNFAGESSCLPANEDENIKKSEDLAAHLKQQKDKEAADLLKIFQEKQRKIREEAEKREMERLKKLEEKAKNKKKIELGDEEDRMSDISRDFSASEVSEMSDEEEGF